MIQNVAAWTTQNKEQNVRNFYSSKDNTSKFYKDVQSSVKKETFEQIINNYYSMHVYSFNTSLELFKIMFSEHEHKTKTVTKSFYYN